MKNLILSAIIALALCSCQKERNIQNSKLIDYEQIGTEHNFGLEFIYDYLVEENKKKELSSQSIDELVNKVSDANFMFLEDKQYALDLNEASCRKMNDKIFYQVLYSENLKSAKSDKTSIEQILENQEVELTENQIIYFQKISNCLQSYADKNLETVVTELTNLKSEIRQNCTEAEADILLIAVSIGSHSLSYWDENLEKWIAEFTDNSNLKSASSDWEWFNETLVAMGKSDVVGGVIGSTVFGVGAVPAACGASAGRGVVALLDEWGVW